MRLSRPIASALALLVTALAHATPAQAQLDPDITIERLSGDTFYMGNAGEGLTGNYEGFRITNTSATATKPDLWVRSEAFTGYNNNNTPVVTLQPTYEDGIRHIGALGPGQSANAYFYLIGTAESANAESHYCRVYATYPGLGSAAAEYQSLITSAQRGATGNQMTLVTNAYGQAVEYAASVGVGGTLVIYVRGQTGNISQPRRVDYTPASRSDWRPDAFELQDVHIAFSGGFTQTVDDFLAFNTANTSDSAYEATYTFRIVGSTSSPTPLRPISYVESGSELKHTRTTMGYPSIPNIPAPVNNLTLSRTPTVTALGASGGTRTHRLRVTSTDAQATVIDDFLETFASGPSTPGYVASSATLTSYDGVTDTTTTTSLSAPYVSGATWRWLQLFPIPAARTSPSLRASYIELAFTASYPAVVGTHVQNGIARLGSTQIDTTSDTTNSSPASVTVYVGNAPDTDGDGIANLVETGDTHTDPNDTDTDGDGLLDGEELGGDGVYDVGTDTNPADADTDDDGLSDGDEADGAGLLAGYGPTDPVDPDSDDDLLPDGLEVSVLSPVPGGTSGGGVGNQVSYAGTNTSSAAYIVDADDNSSTDPTDEDSDGDGLLDGEEDANLDGETLFTIAGTGTSSNASDETDPNADDTDGDGLSDGDEAMGVGELTGIGITDPLDTDTDDGAIADGVEVHTDGTDPTDETDDIYCGNGYVNGSETCDDGANAGGDGCSASCTTEHGFGISVDATAEGRFAQATEAGLGAVALEPLRESAHRVVIEAYLAEDNASEAIRQYRLFEGILESKLGLRPSPRMQELMRALTVR